MPRPAERDWDTLYDIWQATKDKRGKRPTMKTFCQAQSLPLSSTCEAFKRIRKSREQLVEEAGITENSEIRKPDKKPQQFGNKRKTKNNSETDSETPRRFGNDSETPSVDSGTLVVGSEPGEIDYRVFLNARRILVGRLTECGEATAKLVRWANTFGERAEGDGADPKDVRSAAQTLKDAMVVLRDAHPVIAEAEADAMKTQILMDCLANRITAEEAALKFELIGIPMPDAVRIVLSRTPVPEPPPPEGDIPDDAELDALYEEAMGEIQVQRETWRPERREEIAALKEEMAVEAGEGYVRADDHPDDDES